MLAKGYLNIYLTRLSLHSKNIGFLFFVPIVVFVILIPLLNYVQYTVGGVNERLYFNIVRYGQWLMPFFSVWHVIFMLRESIEAEGYELFYVPYHRIKLMDVFGIFGISFLLITLLFLIYGLILPNMWLEYLRILSACFLFLGLAYGITSLFKSITPTIMILIMYLFGSIIAVNHDPIPLLFYTSEMMTQQLFLEHYLILVLLGGVLFSVGYFTNKKFY